MFVQPLKISPLPGVPLTQIQFAVIFILPMNHIHNHTIICLLLIMLTCRKGRSEWVVGFMTTHCSNVASIYSCVKVCSIDSQSVDRSQLTTEMYYILSYSLCFICS
jgi:hypothetical protein